jgi:DNA-directed RNA polymerase subunit omega
MLYPEINKLRDEAGSRYFLVSMAAKRARDLIAGWDPERGYRKLDNEIETEKPVSIAAEEIAEGLLKYIPGDELPEEEETEAPEAESEEEAPEEPEEAPEEAAGDEEPPEEE